MTNLCTYRAKIAITANTANAANTSNTANTANTANPEPSNFELFSPFSIVQGVSPQSACKGESEKQTHHWGLEGLKTFFPHYENWE